MVGFGKKYYNKSEKFSELFCLWIFGLKVSGNVAKISSILTSHERVVEYLIRCLLLRSILHFGRYLLIFLRDRLNFLNCQKEAIIYQNHINYQIQSFSRNDGLDDKNILFPDHSRSMINHTPSRALDRPRLATKIWSTGSSPVSRRSSFAFASA